MKKTLKVKKLIDQNGIQVQNFTMVIRLKKIISQLNVKISEQDEMIMQLKRDTKTTKINEMQVEIQHLNDQNKRLTLMIQELKNRHKKQMLGVKMLGSGMNAQQSITLNNNQQFTRTEGIKQHSSKRRKKSPTSNTVSLLFGSSSTSSIGFTSSMIFSKKSYPEVQKQKEQLMKQQLKQKKFQKKYYELLQQTERLKKQLINMRLNQPQSAKKRKSINCSPSTIDKTSTIFLQRNVECLEKMAQKKHDLEVENDILKAKLSSSEKKTTQLTKQNEIIKKTLQQLKVEIKCRSLIGSDNALVVIKSSTVLKDLSNERGAG